MYGDGKTADNPKDAGALSGSVMKNAKAMEARFNAAREQLARQASVNPQRIGAVGYCFGGAVVLNMARAGADLAAVAGFHASLGLNTPAPRPGTVKAKILILNGADDPFVKREQYDALKKDFDAAKADYRIIEYPGAVHAFTNPEATELGKKFNLPLRYDAKADQEAKAEAAKFFAANLQKYAKGYPAVALCAGFASELVGCRFALALCGRRDGERKSASGPLTDRISWLCQRSLLATTRPQGIRSRISLRSILRAHHSHTQVS